jgi:hypothetical protein
MLKRIAIRILTSGVCAALGLSVFAATQQEVVLKFHFAGFDRVRANKEANQLNKVLSVEETTAFKGELFKRLSASVSEAIFGEKISAQSSLLEPLFEDLYKSEWGITIYGIKGAASEVFIAVSAPGPRQTIWDNNLLKAVEVCGGKATNRKFGALSGWEAKVNGNLNLIRLTKSGDWLVVGLASNKFNAFDELLGKVHGQSYPAAFTSNNWFEADVDLRWLSGVRTPFSGGANYANIAMSSRSGDVRTLITLSYGSAVKWNYEPWQPPQELISDPLVSFTAINGAASLLNEIDVIKKLNLQSMPNQLYLWAQGITPFSTFFAVPVKNATSLMNEFAVKLPPILISTNSISRDGNIYWVSNKAELVWQGLPLMTPFLKAASDKNGQYIFGGLFPAAPSKKNPAPAELYKQFSTRTNLMYYDWEFTRERILQWAQLYQILPLFTKIPQIPESRTGQKWIMKIAPELGDAATEMILKNSNEVLIVRRSTTGLTGFELLQLARWVDLGKKTDNVPAPQPARRNK